MTPVAIVPLRRPIVENWTTLTLFQAELRPLASRTLDDSSCSPGVQQLRHSSYGVWSTTPKVEYPLYRRPSQRPIGLEPLVRRHIDSQLLFAAYLGIFL